MSEFAQHFIEQSRTYLSAEYLPKVRACVERLGPEDLWWRPNPASNGVGHLLLHLDGNLRQWVISGLTGADHGRERAREFAPGTDLPSAAALLHRLTETVGEADAVLAGIDAAGGLQAKRTVQGRQVTELQAIYHAIEHFAMHTGQIIYITKLRTGAGLGFYEVDDGVTRARWEGRIRDL